MSTELRRVTYGNHGVARLTPAPDKPGTYMGMPKFSKAVKGELNLSVQRKNMRNATTTIRNKRAMRVSESPDWQDLRDAAESIKNRVGRHLDHYLVEAEKNLTANGVHVHWARDGEEANRIVAQIAKDKGVDEVVKIKSITSQETDLNEYLEEQGIAAWETDLAELIVQLGHDRPSHIVVPAIHRNRAEVREIFLHEMKNYGRPAPEDISENPPELANAARLHLREKFLRAEMAVSGGNFVLADTGSLVIVESEGNGRMCLTLPDTLVSIVGIEKVLPNFDDLEVFLKLLPRSATGERMNPYNSVWSGVPTCLPTPLVAKCCGASGVLRVSISARFTSGRAVTLTARCTPGRLVRCSIRSCGAWSIPSIVVCHTRVRCVVRVMRCVR